MDTWRTTVRGETWQAIRDAAEDEAVRFFGGAMAGVIVTLVYEVHPHAVVSDGSGKVAAITYEADVSCKI